MGTQSSQYYKNRAQEIYLVDLYSYLVCLIKHKKNIRNLDLAG